MINPEISKNEALTSQVQKMVQDFRNRRLEGELDGNHLVQKEIDIIQGYITYEIPTPPPSGKPEESDEEEEKIRFYSSSSSEFLSSDEDCRSGAIPDQITEKRNDDSNENKDIMSTQVAESPEKSPSKKRKKTETEIQMYKEEVRLTKEAPVAKEKLTVKLVKPVKQGSLLSFFSKQCKPGMSSHQQFP